jgi:glycosyltransferase involved in cell wall biosynthesis
MVPAVCRGPVATPMARTHERLSGQGSAAELQIAVLIACYNEQAAIGRVVREFRQVLPAATIYVYDNNSSDGSAEIAAGAGAVVRHEGPQGKGNVVRRMFADIEADVYVLVDGDATYEAAAAPRLVEALVDGKLDLVNGCRVSRASDAYRRGHRFGNRMLNAIVRAIFGDRFADMLSGFKVFSRRFVKTFPGLSRGFEIEAEVTIHALELGMPVGELPVDYRARPEESASKLKTVRDGVRILWLIARLVRAERPLFFFAALFAVLAASSIALAIPLAITYFETGLVPRLPTAVLATGMMLLAFLCLLSGLILSTITRGRREAKRMRYLAIPAPGNGRET